MKQLFAFAIGVLVIGCTTKSADERMEPETNYNKVAFQTALEAESEKNFRDARFLISNLDHDLITDPDVQELLDFQKRLCSFCIECGISRDLEASFGSLLKSFDPFTAASTVMEKGITNIPAESERIASEAISLRADFNNYSELKKTLALRYGITTP